MVYLEGNFQSDGDALSTNAYYVTINSNPVFTVGL